MYWSDRDRRIPAAYLFIYQFQICRETNNVRLRAQHRRPLCTSNHHHASTTVSKQLNDERIVYHSALYQYSKCICVCPPCITSNRVYACVCVYLSCAVRLPMRVSRLPLLHAVCFMFYFSTGEFWTRSRQCEYITCMYLLYEYMKHMCMRYIADGRRLCPFKTNVDVLWLWNRSSFSTQNCSHTHHTRWKHDMFTKFVWPIPNEIGADLIKRQYAVSVWFINTVLNICINTAWFAGIFSNTDQMSLVLVLKTMNNITHTISAKIVYTTRSFRLGPNEHHQ